MFGKIIYLLAAMLAGLATVVLAAHHELLWTLFGMFVTGLNWENYRKR